LRKISTRGGEFRKVTPSGEAVLDSNTIDVIIIDANAIARMYYEEAYSESSTNAPVCWSSNTRQPDPDVTDRQAPRCLDCTQNIKGSGQGNSRACKFSQRLAVVFEDDLQNIYQLQLPATALFGDANRGWMSMQNYAKHLAKHDTQATTVVTRIVFEESYVPRLRFRPIRVLKTAESSRVAELENDPSTLQAITLDVKPKVTMPFVETDGFVFDEFN
jgi:hypothetical protein